MADPSTGSPREGAWLAAAALRYWRVVALAAAGCLLLGALAWYLIPRRESPRVADRRAALVFAYPGASAELVEAEVVPEIEEALLDIDGVHTLESSATPGRASFLIELEDGADPESTFESLRGAAEQRRAQLPPAVEAPVLRRFSTDRIPQAVVVVAGARSDRVLSDVAAEVKAALVGVRGVSGVDLWGESEPSIRVRVDPVQLAAHGLSIGQVASALRAHNVRVPAGWAQTGEVRTLFEIVQPTGDVAQLMELPIWVRGATGEVLTLGEVADIRREDAPRARRFAFQGLPAVGLAVRFRGKADAKQVDAAIKAVVAEFRGKLPENVRVEMAHSLAEWTGDALSSFFESLAVGVVLVMAVVWLGLGFRAATVVAWVLPLSVAIAILGLYLLGFSVEQLTIAGTIIAMGLLVDDALVVTDSIQLLRSQGRSAVQAAIEGTARVFWANNGTTAIACAAFVPLFFMGGTIGEFLRGLPTAVVLCLAASLFVAQVITPWLSTRILRDEGRAGGSHGERRVGTAGEEDLGPLLAPLVTGYRWLAPMLLRRRKAVLAVCSLLLLAAFAMVPQIGFEFFPRVDKPLLFATVRLPPGASMDQAAEKVSAATAIILRDPAVRDTSAAVAHGYVNIFFGSRVPPAPAPHLGDILIRLKDKETVEATAARLRRSLADVPGAKIGVEELRSGLYVAHPITIRLFGPDYERLRAHADRVRQELEAIPGTDNIEDSLTDTIPLTRLSFDPLRLSQLGLTPAEAAVQVSTFSGEREVTKLETVDGEVDVFVEGAARDFGGGVGRTELASRTGAAVPVSSASAVSLTHETARLLRRDGRRVVEVTADLRPGFLPGPILEQVTSKLSAQRWEPGYDYSFGGSEERQRDSFERLGLAAVGAVTAIGVILVVLFQSFRLTVAVLAALPFGLFGPLLGLWITGRPLGFMSFLGILALLGVYTNHKVYLVDRFRELCAAGFSFEAAIVQAGVDRLRPVVLTALTAVLGLVPLALHGGNVWASFAWPNIFGLLASVPLSLVLVPVLVAIASAKETATSTRLEPAIVPAHTSSEPTVAPAQEVPSHRVVVAPIRSITEDSRRSAWHDSN